MRKRRANSSKSALTSDQLICRGVGQKVRPLARSCVSSRVSVTLDKLTTEDGSRGVLVLGVGSRLVFLRRLRDRVLFVVLKRGWRVVCRMYLRLIVSGVIRVSRVIPACKMVFKESTIKKY